MVVGLRLLVKVPSVANTSRHSERKKTPILIDPWNIYMYAI